MHPIKKAARIAGFIYLSMVFTAPFSLIYVPSKLIVRGNAAATADNILAHETMFRLSIFGDLIGQIMIICLGYVFLSVISFFFPAYDDKAFLYLQPVLFGELAIMLYLVIRGANVKALPARSGLIC